MGGSRSQADRRDATKRAQLVAGESSRRLQDNTSTGDAGDDLLLPAGNLTDGLNSTQGSRSRADRRDANKRAQFVAGESGRRLQDNTSTGDARDDLLLPAGNLTDGLNSTQGSRSRADRRDANKRAQFVAGESGRRLQDNTSTGVAGDDL